MDYAESAKILMDDELVRRVVTDQEVVLSDTARVLNAFVRLFPAQEYDPPELHRRIEDITNALHARNIDFHDTFMNFPGIPRTVELCRDFSKVLYRLDGYLWLLGRIRKVPVPTYLRGQWSSKPDDALSDLARLIGGSVAMREMSAAARYALGGTELMLAAVQVEHEIPMPQSEVEEFTLRFGNLRTMLEQNIPLAGLDPENPEPYVRREALTDESYLDLPVEQWPGRPLFP